MTQQLQIHDNNTDKDNDNNTDNDNDADYTDIELSVIMIDDIEYYFDSDNNLYDINKNIIGTFDPISQDLSIY